MNNRYQLVVFDWEGTISDTLGLILHTISSQATRLGFKSLDPYEARKYVDLGLVKALKKVYPELSLQEHEQLVQAVQDAMAHRSTNVCLIPGAREFIYQLHQDKIDIAIATNKGQHSLHKALEATGLADLFKVTRTADLAPAKPCPQMLEEIMELFGQDASSTVMIGDSGTDMEMAKKIHVTALGVDFYHQQESALLAAGATAVFDNYKLLADFLKLSPK